MDQEQEGQPNEPGAKRLPNTHCIPSSEAHRNVSQVDKSNMALNNHRKRPFEAMLIPEQSFPVVIALESVGHCQELISFLQNKLHIIRV